MLGRWDARCPVRTGRQGVLATAYMQRGATLVALASGAKEPLNGRLQVDWAALGLSAAKTQLEAPAIEHFQPARSFHPDNEMPVPPAKGWVSIFEVQRCMRSCN